MIRIQGRRLQSITIYQDPKTKLNPEGTAILHHFVGKSAHPPYEESWDVEFVDEPGVYQRRTIIFDREEA